MLWLGAAPALAQDPAPPGERIDRVVAVAGDSVVLESDIELALLQMSAQSGRPLPEDPDALEQLRRQAVQQEVEQLLLVQAARRDSIVVGDDEVQSRVDQYMQQQRRSFGGEQAFNQALRGSGMTLEGYRAMLSEQIRSNAVIEMYLSQVQRTRSPPPVTEDEIREYFESRKAELGERPATIAFSQVVVAPRPADSTRTAARARAEYLLAQLRGGAEFADVARRHSDDPGSSDRGGDLGWFRPAEMVPAFADAVRALRPGQLSGIVESRHGFHIIRLERVRAGERQARHILVRPAITDADRERARALADSLATRARAGEPMDSLIDRYGDPTEQSRVDPIPRDQLPPTYTNALMDAGPDDVVGPIELPGADGSAKWAIVKISELTEAGEYSLDDLRDQIRRTLERQLLIDEIIAELRERTYVDIRL